METPKSISEWITAIAAVGTALYALLRRALPSSRETIRDLRERIEDLRKEVARLKAALDESEARNRRNELEISLLRCDLEAALKRRPLPC